jgi:FKBP-type peptidyl-prolyl cis-trans isomerase (trigger factor)
MNVTDLGDENGYHRLSIEAPWSEITADYQEIVARYAKVRLPGFRPGKVPRAVIEQRFQKEIIADLSPLITERLGREAVREAGIEALGPLEAVDIECGTAKPFRAKLRYLPMPQFRLPDLADLKTDDDGTAARDRISHRLLELVPFEVPGELVRQELDLDGLAESTADSDAWTAAAERIRLMVILKRIARQEGIEVDETDVSKRIGEKAEEFGTTKGALQKELEEGGGMARLRDMLLAESTLGYLVEINRQQAQQKGG